MRVRNRVVVPAHQTHFPLEEHNLVGDRYVRYLEARARGGAGLIVAEAAAVHPSAGARGCSTSTGPRSCPGCGAWARPCTGTARSCSPSSRTWATRTRARACSTTWHPVVAPSALPSTVYGRVAQALEPDEIADIVAGYGQAAANAQAAGLDGAEISAVHGYLMTQFLSPFTNRRTDGYGGDVAHRCRFAIEAATEIRRRTGADFALGIRLSFDEHVGEAGLTPATSEEIVRILDATGLFDYFSLSTGNYHTLHQWVPSMTGARDGHLAPDAARAKAAIDGRVPVVVAAAIRTLERAAEIVRDGQADLVAMARAHIADPDLVAKARAGRGREIRRCVGANQGCLRRLFEHGMITCTVNPAAGRERTLGAAPVARRSRAACSSSAAARRAWRWPTPPRPPATRSRCSSARTRSAASCAWPGGCPTAATGSSWPRTWPRRWSGAASTCASASRPRRQRSGTPTPCSWPPGPALTAAATRSPRPAATASPARRPTTCSTPPRRSPTPSAAAPAWSSSTTTATTCRSGWRCCWRAPGATSRW